MGVVCMVNGGSSVYGEWGGSVGVNGGSVYGEWG